MPIETGRYCTHCTDENGQLQAPDQRFERYERLAGAPPPGTPREEIERQTLDYMATIPAWRDHPASPRDRANGIGSYEIA